jgi:hypothetical protein
MEVVLLLTAWSIVFIFMYAAPYEPTEVRHRRWREREYMKERKARRRAMLKSQMAYVDDAEGQARMMADLLNIKQEYHRT